MHAASASTSIMENEVTEKKPVNDEYDYLNWFPEIVPDVIEKEPPMKLVYHHGGGFITEPTLRYVNGEVREFDWWDVDKLCSWRFFNIAIDIGYSMEEIEKIQYCDKDDALETGLKDLESDESVQLLSVVLLEKKAIDIYVIHPNNGEGLKKHGGAEMGEGLETSRVLLPAEMQVEKPSRNSVEVDTTSSEESGDENDEEDGVDEELNPKKLIWDNDDDNGELVTSRVKLSQAIEHEEQLWKEINEVNVDADIEDNPGPETAGPATAGPTRRVKSRANKRFPDFPKPRPRRRVEEVYLDSSDPGSFSETGSDSDSDDARRHPSSKFRFRPDAPIELYKEQIFSGKEQFKAALNEYSLKKCFAYEFKKNDKVRVRAICASRGCGWEILCSKHNADDSWRVKTYHSLHNHKLNAKRNRRVTAQVVADCLEDDIIKIPMKAIHVMRLVKKRLGVFINIGKARRAKLFVIRKQQMQYIEEFKRLRGYADELGLLNAIGDGMPFVEQRRCARHIYARWGKKFPKDELKYQFWKCAKITNEHEFNKEMDVLKSMDATAHNYLIKQWDVRHWSLAFASDFSKCDVIDNNMCETFNGVIVEARENPIITMLEEIRLYVMRRIVKNRQQALDWKTEYGPRILAKLEKNWKRADNWEVDWDGGVAFEVYHDNIELSLRERFIVSLEGKTCSCRGWDVSGVPCHHAIAAILYCGKEPADYLDDCFKRDEFLKAYQALMHPCQGLTFWSKGNGDDILPPPVRKPKGRDKKERRREALEAQKHSAKMSRIGRKMTCSICKKADHNKATCPKNFQNKQKKKRTESQSSNQQSTSQHSATTFSVPPSNVQVVNNFTTVRKLKEDARKMRHDRAAGTSNDQQSCQP
ncbi:Transposase, MuDR, plant [Corchorus olitorius]|uniref:Transposase, MuDR, plant n=1 Tax=Corchorus olitorius TaxID=93759 RepID=A0A1R3HIH5_9ROSI|nr:Transposase, MuDR, plant [Corchorus olitorius]